MRITNTADFIKRANEVHNGYYDYSQTVYVKSNEKVKIICPIHGVFEQTPIEQLNEWKQRAKLKGSHYYYAAIDTWTKRDVLKLQTAIDNDLNYLVFWRNDLQDVRDWLKSHNLL